MTRRPRRTRAEAGHLVAGLALTALVLMVTSVCQLLAQGTP
ncbi:hypothetical protein [Streptomyces sp. AMCC400023]|nr:hypothetical protein [Streptomyces sp. AMCC400023]